MRKLSCLLFFAAILCVLGQKVQDFVATEEWQEIKEGQKVPGGLHYRMNLETGKKEAKLLQEEEEQKDASGKKSFAPVLSVENPILDSAEPEDKLSPERVKEMQNILDKMKMNKDIDNIMTLMAHFANSSTEQKLVILEDLDYYMHQIDNAKDFVTLHGLTQIVLPSLMSLEPELVGKAAILLGSASQANTLVQVKKYFKKS